MRLVIVGDSLFAEVAYELFDVDSDFEPVAFAVSRSVRSKSSLLSKPVIDLEDLPELFDPATTYFYAAITYGQLNRLRTRLYVEAKQMGFRPATYIASHASVWRNAAVGEHCFIFEDNTIQPFVSIGNNVVLWSGNHVGHHSLIGNNCFVASQAVISGSCKIGDNSFIGVNATIANDVSIGIDCWIGLGATIARDVPAGSLHRGPRDEVDVRSTYERFGVQP